MLDPSVAPRHVRRPGDKPPLSIVIPAYNERERLGRTLEAIASGLEGRDYELLVVDDGSEDGTREVALAMDGVRVIRLAKNQGKGAAVRRGMLAARGRKILFTDADLSTPISELGRLEQALARTGAAVAIGSRALEEAVIELSQPRYRVWMGKTYNLLVQATLLPGVWDTQCGFKLFSHEAARAVFTRARLSGFGFDVEALFLARQLGFALVEVPVRWRNDPATRVRPIRDAARMLQELWQVRLTHGSGCTPESAQP